LWVAATLPEAMAAARARMLSTLSTTWGVLRLMVAVAAGTSEWVVLAAEE